jgi:hypothetical protein
MDVLIEFNICPKRGQFWGVFFMFDLLPFFSPSFLVTIVTFGQEKEGDKNIFF